MTRTEGWELRLVAAIEAAQGRSWAWGKHDCCAFARSCVAAMTGGATPWDEHYTYGTEAEAEAIVGGGGLARLLDAHATRCAPRMAGRGDLAAVPSDYGPAGMTLGVVEGAWVWCAAPRGLARVALDSAVTAWRIA